MRKKHLTAQRPCRRLRKKERTKHQPEARSNATARASDFANEKHRRGGVFHFHKDGNCAYFLAPRCVCRSAVIMKLSNLFSATWNHCTWSSRNFFHGS